jgi:hypothetical protein
MGLGGFHKITSEAFPFSQHKIDSYTLSLRVRKISSLSLSKENLPEGVPITSHKQPPKGGNLAWFSAQESPLKKTLDKSTSICYY